MMLCAALGGVVFAGMTGNVWIGLLGAVVIGVLVGAVIAFSSLSGKTDLYLTCIAVNLAATGGTVFVMYLLTGEKATTSAAIKAYTLPTVVLPLINKIPLIGPMLSGHNVLTYLAFISIFAVWFFLTRTRLGLRLRAVGENARAAASVGINVKRIGYVSFLISGVLCGFGGAFMSMSYAQGWSLDMVAGRGFIALAAQAMGSGECLGGMLSSLVFGFAQALGIKFSAVGLDSNLASPIPYAVTIIGLVIFSLVRRSRAKKLHSAAALK